MGVGSALSGTNAQFGSRLTEPVLSLLCKALKEGLSHKVCVGIK